MALIGWHNFLHVQYKRAELLDPVTMVICPKKSFDHGRLSKEELVDIDKKFD